MSRILVVDDDDLIRRACKLLLGSKDHQVTFANDGAQALRQLADFRPDILITDIYMPEMNGLELIAKVREIAPGTGIIAFSGGGQFRDVGGLVMARSLGADVCIEKPLKRTTLLEAVDRLGNCGPDNLPVGQVPDDQSFLPGGP